MNAAGSWAGDLPAADRAFGVPTRLLLLLGALALGVAATAAPALTLVVLALPVLFVLVATRPEWILILFLTAGIYKQDPRIADKLPLDITVVMGAVMVLATAIDMARRRFSIPMQLALLAPMILMIARGLLGGAPDYGVEKATRFCSLTMLAILGGCVLLDDRTRMDRFLQGLAILGFILSVDATQNSQTTSEGRLTAHGSNPIALARVGALTLAFGWIRFHFGTKPLNKLVTVLVLGVACLCVLAAGSRGPVLSIVLSMGLISLAARAYHGRSPISVTTIVMVATFAVLIITCAAMPQLPLYRFQLLFSEDKGTSIFVRGLLFATAFKLMLANPLGLGVGGFARHAILDLRYPHNLFLEVGCELGWLSLLGLMMLMALSVRRAFANVKAEYSWATVFMAVAVMASSMNAMVTGDINDNRMLFALLLLPFVQARHLLRDRRSGVHARTVARPV